MRAPGRDLRFGRGRDGAPWSDADIGIAGCAFWEELALGAELGSRIGREAHVISLDLAPESLRYELARKGVLIFEREPGEWARYRAESFVRWFDFAPYHRRFVEGMRRRALKEAGLG